MFESMSFPNNIEDFIESYSFYDSEQVYTNGSKMIPVFRVIQGLNHYFPKDDGTSYSYKDINRD